MATYKKVGEELEVAETIPQEIIPVKVETTKFNRKFLDEQKIRVEEDLANVKARHTQELAVAQANVDKVGAFILECDKLGIK